jgi:hypothetical protein
MQNNANSVRHSRERVREPENVPPSASSFLRALPAVLGAFIGIRKGSASERDLASLNPLHVIAAAVLAAALFVIIIVTLVGLIT